MLSLGKVRVSVAGGGTRTGYVDIAKKALRVANKKFVSTRAAKAR